MTVPHRRRRRERWSVAQYEFDCRGQRCSFADAVVAEHNQRPRDAPLALPRLLLQSGNRDSGSGEAQTIVDGCDHNGRGRRSTYYHTYLVGTTCYTDTDSPPHGIYELNSSGHGRTS